MDETGKPEPLALPVTPSCDPQIIDRQKKIKKAACIAGCIIGAVIGAPFAFACLMILGYSMGALSLNAEYPEWSSSFDGQVCTAVVRRTRDPVLFIVDGAAPNKKRPTEIYTQASISNHTLYVDNNKYPILWAYPDQEWGNISTLSSLKIYQLDTVMHLADGSSITCEETGGAEIGYSTIYSISGLNRDIRDKISSRKTSLVFITPARGAIVISPIRLK